MNDLSMTNALRILQLIDRGNDIINYSLIVSIRLIVIAAIWSCVAYGWVAIRRNSAEAILPELEKSANEWSASVGSALGERSILIASLAADPRLPEGLLTEEGVDSSIVRNTMYEFSFIKRNPSLLIWQGNTGMIGRLTDADRTIEDDTLQTWMRSLIVSGQGIKIFGAPQNPMIYVASQVKGLPDSVPAFVALSLGWNRLVRTLPPAPPLDAFPEATSGFVVMENGQAWWADAKHDYRLRELGLDESTIRSAAYSFTGRGDLLVARPLSSSGIDLDGLSGGYLLPARSISGTLTYRLGLVGCGLVATLLVFWPTTRRLSAPLGRTIKALVKASGGVDPKESQDRIAKAVELATQKPVSSSVPTNIDPVPAPVTRVNTAENDSENVSLNPSPPPANVQVSQVLPDPAIVERANFPTGSGTLGDQVTQAITSPAGEPVNSSAPPLWQAAAVTATNLGANPSSPEPSGQSSSYEKPPAPESVDEPRDKDDVILELIKDCLKYKRTTLIYQPIFGLQGKPVMHEVFLRLQNAQNDLIPPDVFLPVAEKNGLVAKLDERVLEQLMELHFSEGRVPPTRLAINVSGRSLADISYLEYLIVYGFRMVEHLSFEVRSQDLLKDPAAVDYLRQFHDVGVRMGIDYFGGGPNMVEASRRLGFDIVKIDATKYTLDDTSKKELIIVARTAARLGMPIILEKIEHPTLITFARKAGISMLQGYIFGKPKPELTTGFLSIPREPDA